MPSSELKTEAKKKHGIFDPSIMLHRERVSAAEPMSKPAK